MPPDAPGARGGSRLSLALATRGRADVPLGRNFGAGMSILGEAARLPVSTTTWARSVIRDRCGPTLRQGVVSLSLRAPDVAGSERRPQSGGGWWHQQGDDSFWVGEFQRDEAALAKADELPIGVPVSNKLASAARCGRCPTHIAGLGSEPTRSRRRVIVRAQAVALVGVDADEPIPDVCCLAGPCLAGVDNAMGPNTEPVDRPMRDPADVFGAAVGERPLRVFGLGRGLTVLAQVHRHRRHGWRGVAPSALSGPVASRGWLRFHGASGARDRSPRTTDRCAIR